MIVLYIDTTTSYLYLGLSKDNNIYEVKKSYNSDLSKHALNDIKELLETHNLTPKDVSKIIVVNGPGSFTGIRIGVTIAKTFAYSLNIPITTISSLDAMSLSLDLEYDYIIPIIDARRNYVYAGIYDKDNNIILPNQYIKLDVLKVTVDNLIGNYVFIGNTNIIDDIKEYSPNISKIINTYKDKESINPHFVNPIYLKLTEAEENKKIEII